MSYSVSVQLTKFQNLNSEGKSVERATYGYRIYSEDTTEYSNVYENVDELLEEINEDTILDFICQNHSDFYDIIKEDGGFYFNGEEVDLDDDEDDNDSLDEYDENFVEDVFDGDEELAEEVEKIIEEASENLI